MAASWTLLDAFSTTSSQATTEAAPSLPSDGVNLDGVMAITVWLDAGAGQTILSDSGQVDLYVLDNGLWGIAPAIVMAVPPNSAGQRRVSLGSVTIENRRGRLAPIANTLSVSGSGVTLDIMITLDRHGQARPA